MHPSAPQTLTDSMTSNIDTAKEFRRQRIAAMKEKKLKRNHPSQDNLQPPLPKRKKLAHTQNQGYPSTAASTSSTTVTFSGAAPGWSGLIFKVPHSAYLVPDSMDKFHSPKSHVEEEFESTLHSAPSFAIYNNPLEHDDTDPEQVLKKTTAAIIGSSGAEFSFGLKKMDLIEEGDVELEPPSSPPMYLAVSTGVGIDGTGFDDMVGSHDFISDDIFNPNLQGEDLEEYYKKMVDEYPSHPLVLKKYAQHLQSKGDIQGAEKYFLRATLADPGDVDILIHYAKLVWEQHRDEDKALDYFERAAQAAPQDSHVLAAYTSFLWETEDDENEVEKHETQNDKEKQKTEPAMPSKEENDPVSPFSLLADGQEIDTANFSEDDFNKMIGENPNNPLFMKKYAQFLFQSKRDLQAAEDYYSRAILADPSDGEIMSEYARLEWELHHDREKVSNLFEQAVQATPGNSNILAAYVCFLWEIEDEES